MSAPRTAPLLIGIDGRSGAGKTTLAVELCARLRQHRTVSLFHLEDIYPGWQGLDQGIQRYLDSVLAPLSTGHDAEWTTWDWAAGTDGPLRTTPAADVVVIEGVGACAAGARELLDATIWVSGADDERKSRALARDGESYVPFWDTWAEQEERWLATDPVPASVDVTVRDAAGEGGPGEGGPGSGHAVDEVLELLSHHPALHAELAPERSALASRPVRITAAGPLASENGTALDAGALFAELFRNDAHAVWLDSSDAGLPGATRNRFSIMAGNPGAGLSMSHRRGVTELRRGTSSASLPLPFFRWLATAWTPQPLPAGPTGYDCPFRLGWLGWLGYELKRETGGSDQDTSGSAVPDAGLLFADHAVVLDHQEGLAWALELAGTEPDDDAPAPAPASPGAGPVRREGWAAAVARALETARTPTDAAPGTVTAAPASPAPRFTARDTHQDYLAKVLASQDEIREGNSYEVCLTTTLTADASGFDVTAAYRALRRRNPAPFAALLRFGDVSIASTSPERFLSIDAGGGLLAEPIKGTRRRSADAAEDAALREDLSTSLKDRAENIMIVDLLRNDLSHFAEPGSVTVSRLCAIESYATVHQMVSSIRAQLRPGASRVEAVAAAFPAGSMTGAPKISTMAILDGLEGGPRGIYSGALGYFSLDGSVDLSVVIRTLVASGAGEDTRLSLGVGGAVTADSVPEDEYQEIRTKAYGVLSTLGAEYPE
ncbi:para-aminobenzoate synthetase [Arthrobacter woluwensis]|uniref:aminodeoxychorismate synthase component I n=1 Tax=Arthrobacter woluwensis TaxID=156980 RepID=UPI002788C15D|nr:aminodeoxychorismate synthase component I [Arthrobacter woluwensis]MDQ0710179.1 para-aminobenzoate synthetase [Arthrobacter woluwensis]